MSFTEMRNVDEAVPLFLWASFFSIVLCSFHNLEFYFPERKFLSEKMGAKKRAK